MKIHAADNERPMILDVVTPVLCGIETVLNLFEQPEIFLIEGNKIHIKLVSIKDSLELDTIDVIRVKAKELGADAWLYATEMTVKPAITIRKIQK